LEQYAYASTLEVEPAIDSRLNMLSWKGKKELKFEFLYKMKLTEWWWNLVLEPLNAWRL
jgi:hypothetical protein